MACSSKSSFVRIMRTTLTIVIVAFSALTLSKAARAATITVNSLADTGAPGICALPDAITAANTMTATNGCVAGTGNDTIQFSVKGTIFLVSTLPQITDANLTIIGPSSPGIKIDGGDYVQVMQVAYGTTVDLVGLTIAHGSVNGNGGGIDNSGMLTVTNSTFSDNHGNGGGGIDNMGTLTVTNSTFSNNVAVYGGGINNFTALTV